MKTADVVIVGGGIIGCSIAYQLGKRGVHTLVLEQDEIGMQASSAAIGMLAPFHLTAKPGDEQVELRRKSLALFPALSQELEEQTGIDIEYQQTGSLRIADAGQHVRLIQWMQDWRAVGVDTNIIYNDLRRVEPALSPAHRLAVRIPCEAQVRAPRYMQAIARAAELAGATLASHTALIGIKSREEGTQAVYTSRGDMIACGSLVVAAGAWSNMVMGLLNSSVQVKPQGGQAIEVAQPATPVRHLLFGDGVYIAPKSKKHLYIGATHEDMGFSPAVSEESTSKLLAAARALVPGISDTHVRAWAGLRPAARRDGPYIGRASVFPNVFLATGHGGFGILLSAITGQMIADLIISEKQSRLDCNSIAVSIPQARLSPPTRLYFLPGTATTLYVAIPPRGSGPGIDRQLDSPEPRLSQAALTGGAALEQENTISFPATS